MTAQNRLLREIETLPVDYVPEVIDFIGYLKTKYLSGREPKDDGSLAYLFQSYADDHIREPIVDFGEAVGNEQW
jgi:hypothetical protein